MPNKRNRLTATVKIQLNLLIFLSKNDFLENQENRRRNLKSVNSKTKQSAPKTPCRKPAQKSPADSTTSLLNALHQKHTASLPAPPLLGAVDMNLHRQRAALYIPIYKGLKNRAVFLQHGSQIIIVIDRFHSLVFQKPLIRG